MIDTQGHGIGSSLPMRVVEAARGFLSVAIE